MTLLKVSQFRPVFLASILVPALLFGFGAWDSHRRLYAEAEAKVRHNATVLYEHAAKVLQTHALVSEQVRLRVRDLSWEEIQNSKPLWDELKRLVDQVQQVDAIFLIRPDGKAGFTTRAYPAPDITFEDRDYFVAQQERDVGPYLSGSYIGKISKRPIFNFSIRKETPSGEFDGVVGVSAFVEYFTRFYKAAALPEDNTFIARTREDGQILARYPTITQPAKLPPESPLLQHAKQSDHGVYRAVSLTDGVPRIIAYKRLEQFPAFVSYGIDERTVQATWIQYLIGWALLSVVAALALFSIAWMAARRAQREIEAAAVLQGEISRSEQAERALIEKHRLEALGQLTGGVAHDFNNLLQVLGPNLEIASETVQDQRTKRLLDSCLRAVERGEKMTHQLLAFASRQNLTLSVVDIGAQVAGLADILQQLAGRRNPVSIESRGDTWSVETDATQLERGIMNLVANARDAMPNGGEIRNLVENRVLSGRPDGLTGGFVAIAVSDTGAGIPPDVLPRIWDPFFTTKPAGKGTGLGLSTVYGYAKQSGGSVSVESAVNKGTTVTILLPKADRLTERDKADADGKGGSLVPFPQRAP